MLGTGAHPLGWQQSKVLLFALTLATSAIHFADNAYRLDLYPGPVWLTRDVILAVWFLLPVSACLAYWVDTRTALVAYGALGFDGLAHFLMPHRMDMPLRCEATIGAEVAASALLIAYALLRPCSPRMDAGPPPKIREIREPDNV